MSKSDAREALDLNQLFQQFGPALRLAAAYTANATTMQLERGIPMSVMPNGTALIIGGVAYIVTTGGTFSATGTLTVTITANATAQSNNVAVTNGLWGGMLTPATAPTGAVLEAGAGTNFTEPSYTGNGGGTYARQLYVPTAVAGAGVDSTTTQTFVGDAVAMNFPVYGSGYGSNLVVQDIILFNTNSAANSGDREEYYADGFTPVTISPAGQPTFAVSSSYNTGLTIVEQ